jgi:putative acetyltransferase
MNEPKLRAETIADAPAIRQVIQRAFATLTVGVRTEHRIVDALRDAGALSVSLVAESQGEIIGHVALSPIVIDDGTPGWYGLGPVAVLQEWQRIGIGQQLIRAALQRAQDAGGNGCVVLGHPDYYPRFGFSRDHDLTLPGFTSANFFALRWRSGMPSGVVRYHPAFAAE